ncbi:MAG: DUF2828 family protein [Oscillospiraceae bacterium]|nr:DUF2828 family protein [Oscillospiraceae bacterium]
MKNFIDLLMNENMTETENGAAAYTSTGSQCLDLFSAAGALRSNSEDDIIDRFSRAYAEDADTAMRILFYARDVRGGLGERRIFRIILKFLAYRHPESVIRNMSNIAEYGRYDDLMVLMGTPLEDEAVRLISAQLREDKDALAKGEQVSLMAKWLPSANASSAHTVKTAKRLAGKLGLTEREYRHTLTALRSYIHIIENELRSRDYTFDYSEQCSRAMFKYRQAFIRNDRERYLQYLEDLRQGKTSMNTENIYPYEIVDAVLSKGVRFLSADECAALNTMWAKLPDYACGNALAVVDTSGSMYSGTPTPASVAFSLGIYLADKNKGPFGGCFMEFSDKPVLIKLKGETFADRLRYAASFSRIADTNIEAVFDLILTTAVRNRVKASDLPRTLILISDMEFNSITSHADRTVFEHAKRKFGKYGYKLPQIVFWNVQSRNGHQPVRMDEKGVILVSGCSAKTFEMVITGNTSPARFMKETLSSQRYRNICA